ncbi:hypothetical protein B9Z19DRAFT_258555 [Tuber borchii]|uniref:Uncharacterized protein n=1 Tax=Tuber borchii TaxID=42251 RepID=A0A2T6ZLK5_TUBBO|nr:hypothetical protein B9Z19DRAFT_258555 [Tuber borchii]
MLLPRYLYSSTQTHTHPVPPPLLPFTRRCPCPAYYSSTLLQHILSRRRGKVRVRLPTGPSLRVNHSKNLLYRRIRTYVYVHLKKNLHPHTLYHTLSSSLLALTIYSPHLFSSAPPLTFLPHTSKKRKEKPFSHCPPLTSLNPFPFLTPSELPPSTQPPSNANTTPNQHPFPFPYNDLHPPSGFIVPLLSPYILIAQKRSKPYLARPFPLPSPLPYPDTGKP